MDRTGLSHWQVKPGRVYEYQGNHLHVSSTNIDGNCFCVWGSLHSPSGELLKQQTVVAGDGDWQVPLTPLPQEVTHGDGC